MYKLYSETIGKPVFTEYSSRSIALIRDLIVDPETGKLLAFVVGTNRIIVPMDVETFSEGIVIADKDRILPISDVLRVQEVLKMRTKIIEARVVTQHRKVFLGKAIDFEIDTILMAMTKIYAAKKFIFFRFQEKIISYTNIVSIGRKVIVVKDSNEAMIKDKATVRPEAFAA